MKKPERKIITESEIIELQTQKVFLEKQIMELKMEVLELNNLLAQQRNKLEGDIRITKEEIKKGELYLRYIYIYIYIYLLIGK